MLKTYLDDMQCALGLTSAHGRWSLAARGRACWRGVLSNRSVYRAASQTHLVSQFSLRNLPPTPSVPLANGNGMVLHSCKLAGDFIAYQVDACIHVVFCILNAHLQNNTPFRKCCPSQIAAMQSLVKLLAIYAERAGGALQRRFAR